MITDSIRVITYAIAAAVLLVVLFKSIADVKRKRRPITMSFFAFGVIGILVNDVYWWIHSLMYPDIRFPFSPDEIGACAVYMLMSAALLTIFDKPIKALPHTAFTAAFSAANIALWIGWSGEWIKDIISGVVFAYLLCTCVRSLKESDVFSKKQWAAAAAAALALVCIQTLIFFISSEIQKLLDIFCYILMLAACLYLYVRALLSLKKSSLEERTALSFSAFSCCLVSMYMSAEPIYFMFSLGYTLCTVIMFLAIHGTEKERCDDLR